MYNVPSEASRLDPRGAESVIPVGPLAQLGERRVRNAEVVGSNPMRSTTFCLPLCNELATKSGNALPLLQRLVRG